MGLDIYLYQFQNLDTDAILKLWRYSEEPWSFEAFHNWTSLPESERGVFPSEKDKAESRITLKAKAKELELPETIVGDGCLGGLQVSFASKLHPEWLVGDWYSLTTTRALMMHFTGNGLDYVFSEANKTSRLFRPDWLTAKKKLTEILSVLRQLSPAQIDSFNSGLSGSINHHLNQIEVMIETLDFVLDSNNPKEFLVLWSD